LGKQLELWRQRGKYSSDIEDICGYISITISTSISIRRRNGRKDNQQTGEDMIDK